MQRSFIKTHRKHILATFSVSDTQPQPLPLMHMLDLLDLQPASHFRRPSGIFLLPPQLLLQPLNFDFQLIYLLQNTATLAS